MADTPEKVELPEGPPIYYRDSDHSYWEGLNKKGDGGTGRVPGMSTVTKPLDYEPGGLLRWAARTNGVGIAELVSDALAGDPMALPGELDWLTDHESIWRELSERKLTFEDVRDRAAERGTNVHQRVLHALAVGAKVPSLADLSDDERGYGQAVMAWWHDRDPVALEAEQVVYSTTHHVAGRFDLRAKIDDEVWLVDAKTSGFISNAAHAQLRGYELAARECGVGTSERQVILRLDPSGTYDEIECVAEEIDFVTALATYQSSKRIGRDARKAARANG